jgi:hypothetical protein
VKFCFSLAAGLFLAACAEPRQALVVRQFQLRNQVIDTQEEPSIRMEKLRRLHGAVSMEDRKKKLGQYYTFFWNDAEAVGQGKVELVFQYQQGTSGSRIKKMSREFPASAAEGTAEFAVIGDDYFIGGKVLTWKATLRRGNRELATRQSYLWQ